MSKDLITQKQVNSLPYKAEKFNTLFEHIKIQTNNICTRMCPFCYFGNKIDPRVSGQILKTDVVYQLIDELAALGYSGRLSFFEINEPLTDARIYDFLKYSSAKLPKAWNMLITNGDLLTIDKLQRLFEAGLDNLHVSIYDQLSLDRLESLRDINPGFFNNVELMNFIDEVFVDNRGGYLDNYEKSEKLTQPILRPCERVYKIMCVKPSGNVVSCGSDFYENNVVGNVMENSLHEIWFGKKFTQLRSELDRGNRNYSKVCAKCNYGGMGGFFKK